MTMSYRLRYQRGSREEEEWTSDKMTMEWRLESLKQEGLSPQMSRYLGSNPLPRQRYEQEERRRGLEKLNRLNQSLGRLGSTQERDGRGGSSEDE